MRLVVVYHPKSDYTRAVETFIEDFKRLHEGPGRRMDAISTESREGMAILSLYDIFERPAIMVIADNGSLVKHWTGATLPLMDEVAAYFYTSQSQ